MELQNVEQLAQRFIDALHRLEREEQGALDGMAALFSDDAQVTNAMLRRVGKDHSGAEGVREFWDEYQRMFREIRSEFYQVTTNEQAAGLFWTSKGTDAGGRQIDYDGTSLLVFNQEGRIKLFRGYYDTSELHREMGGRT